MIPPSAGSERAGRMIGQRALPRKRRTSHKSTRLKVQQWHDHRPTSIHFYLGPLAASLRGPAALLFLALPRRDLASTAARLLRCLWRYYCRSLLRPPTSHSGRDGVVGTTAAAAIDSSRTGRIGIGSSSGTGLELRLRCHHRVPMQP